MQAQTEMVSNRQIFQSDVQVIPMEQNRGRLHTTFEVPLSGFDFRLAAPAHDLGPLSAIMGASVD
jgi:hypothetical protein